MNNKVGFPLLVSLALHFAACADGRAVNRSTLEFVETSGSPLEEVPTAARFSLRGLGELAPEDLVLVRGELSSVSQSRLREGQVPGAVDSKRVPLVVQEREDSFELFPSEFLVEAEAYSVAAIGYGLVAEFSVTADSQERALVVSGQDAGVGDWVIYCTDDAMDWGGISGLRQRELSVEVRLGLDESLEPASCLRLGIGGKNSGLFVPPARLGDRELDPAPLFIQESWQPHPLVPLECSDSEEALGDACVRLVGGAAELRLPAGNAAVQISWGQQVLRRHSSSTSSEEIVMGPLPASEEVRIEVWTWAGASVAEQGIQRAFVTLPTGEAQARFVVTEALGDPYGPEPQSEWVEITNVGNAAGRLLGVFLWDSSGGVPLPDVSLSPGEFGLIVREDFQFDADVAPASDAKPVVVPSIGHNGLRNSGEQVELRDDRGTLLSSLAALDVAAGRSVQRADPWGGSANVRASSEPGGSPGRSNTQVLGE